ncbi:MAG: hypothetical protein EHM24_09710 [Acidobacteria bacterium]|nr:MAG: hypothetical protein EHM24_09710 [Acidobacteriota bacterium]
MRSRSYLFALAAALALVVARAFVWVYYPHTDFDSDQAIVGLMAKHLAEGRAFPLFFYGQPYLLGVEAWIAAPVFLVTGATPVALKGTVLALNLVVAWLLLRELVRSTGLGAWTALACSVFVLLPPPITAAFLVRAVGMNIEPFLAVLLLWMTRRRPVLFGVVLALGVLNREFTIYGLTALIAVEILDRSLFTRPALAARGLSLLVFAAAWDLIRVLTPYSSTHGPGTPPGILATGAGSLATVSSFANFSMDRLWSDVRRLLSGPLPDLLNMRTLDVSIAAGPIASPQGAAWLGPVLLVALGVPLAAAVARAATRATRRSPGSIAFPLFLTLVGAQSALVYAGARGEAMSIFTQRYMLLALLLPVGVAALVMRTVPSRVLKGLAAGGLLVWGAVALADTAGLARRVVSSPPPDRRDALVQVLVRRGIRYGTADYWDAYAVAFASHEQVRLHSGIPRIREYERLVAAHDDEAVSLKRRACEGCEEVAGWWITEKGRPWQ